MDLCVRQNEQIVATLLQIVRQRCIWFYGKRSQIRGSRGRTEGENLCTAPYFSRGFTIAVMRTSLPAPLCDSGRLSLEPSATSAPAGTAGNIRRATNTCRCGTAPARSDACGRPRHDARSAQLAGGSNPRIRAQADHRPFRSGIADIVPDDGAHETDWTLEIISFGNEYSTSIWRCGRIDLHIRPVSGRMRKFLPLATARADITGMNPNDEFTACAATITCAIILLVSL